MHHALDLLEVLYNIFGHLAPHGERAWTYEGLPGTRTLAQLTRTCQAFKEPALDVLWSELPDLSALARCVPNAICSNKRCYYAFKRPLIEAEWMTIRSYARRVWIFLDCSLRGVCLEEESIAMLFNYTGNPLFPSLRSLSWCHGSPLPLLHAPSRQLRTLHLDCRCGEIPECLIDTVGNLCSHLTSFRLHLSHQHVEFDSIVSSHVLRWTNLRILECSHVALNADAILHISTIPTLTHLSFVLSEEASGQIFLSGHELVFLNLTRCEITSERILPVANLLARARFLAVKRFTVKFPGSPSRQTIQSFMMALKNACSSGTLTHLNILNQRSLWRRLRACSDAEMNDCCPISYDDLCPCMALPNLRLLRINLDQPIHLTDENIVNLGSAWPHLEDLSINDDAGWRSTGGLTLHGLVGLLRACTVLRNFCILFDTPSFRYIPRGMDVSYPPRQLGRVNLVESPLDADIFSGVVDVFAAIGFSPRLLIAWQRAGIGQGMPTGSAQSVIRSWSDLAEEVKAKIASARESEDKLCS